LIAPLGASVQTSIADLAAQVWVDGRPVRRVAEPASR
jgi:hypothetical protein